MRYLVNPGIIGGAGELLTLTLEDVTSFKSQNLIPISTPYEYEYTFEAIETSEGAQAAGAGMSYTFIFTFLLSMLVSVLTGSSMELMWSLANTLQIIFI